MLPQLVKHHHTMQIKWSGMKIQEGRGLVEKGRSSMAGLFHKIYCHISKMVDTVAEVFWPCLGLRARTTNHSPADSCQEV